MGMRSSNKGKSLMLIIVQTELTVAYFFFLTFNEYVSFTRKSTGVLFSGVGVYIPIFK